MNLIKSREPASALAGAFLLGLLAAPWVYAAMGALGAFPPPFAAIVTPLLFVTTLDLAIEAFTTRKRYRRLRVAGIVLSALVLLTILWGLSGFTLLTLGERAGLFATIWLAATAVWLIFSLPFPAVGPERSLRPRLDTPIRSSLVLGIVVLLICVLAAFVYRELTTPHAFIG
jgi:hypothetical protein